MITAVDTSVLLDVFGGDPEFGPLSRSAVRSSLIAGRLIACGVVLAEVAAFFPSTSAAWEAMNRLGLEFVPLGAQAALEAGVAWRAYRSRGGKRDRMIPDFLIGAHATSTADRLLTRDRGLYRSFFAGLKVLEPSAA